MRKMHMLMETSFVYKINMIIHIIICIIHISIWLYILECFFGRIVKIPREKSTWFESCRQRGRVQILESHFATEFSLSNYYEADFEEFYGICMYMYTYVHLNLNIYMYTYTYTYICIYTYICMYIYIYMYKCVYIHTYTYTHIYIHTYTNNTNTLTYTYSHTHIHMKTHARTRSALLAACESRGHNCSY